MIEMKQTSLKKRRMITPPLLGISMNARILIVDDEADIRHALGRILQLEGYSAEEASSGPQALQLLKKNSYDLMILDMRMPSMSGIEVMDTIRETHPNLCIIILTGQATLESAIAAAKSDGVENYLLKPVSNEEFVEAVASALTKRAQRLRQQKLVKAAAQMLGTMQHPEISADPLTGAELLPPSTSTENRERFIHVHPLTLDRKKRLMTIVNEAPPRIVELTKGEAAVLSTLMMHPDQTLSCYELVCNALGYDIDESEAESVIRPYIFRLRRKLEPSPRKPFLIHTVRRRGYCFSTDLNRNTN